MEITYKNQTALITGGTRGIGAEIVKAIAAANGIAIFTGTSKFQPQWLDSESKKYDTSRFKYYQLELGTDRWENQIDNIISENDNISVCINNAGINKISEIDEIDTDDLRKILEINLLAPIVITAKISKIMKHNQYGRIVNVSSIFGISSKIGRSSYSASKAGLIGQTKTAALELAGSNILVNAICPGFTRTDLTEQILGEEGIKEISKTIPLGRLAEPHEIASAILFLASNLNTYITGQTLIADGGFLAQ